MQRILRKIDSINEFAGSISSWLIILMIFVILYEVIARYVFNAPTSWAFGDMRMIGGALIVLGWAYAELHNSHIRVDVFYTHLSPRKQALVDIIGHLLFFFPLFGGLTWLLLKNFSENLEFHNFLKLQFWFSVPNLFNIIIVIGFCLTFLQFTAQFLRDTYTIVKGTQYD
jgi:TRAP-type mannitol/chloroaromatic compound transport system permease small subunit